MVNKSLNLDTNSRLLSINSIKTITDMISSYNNKNLKPNINYHLLDRYSTLCLLKLMMIGNISSDKLPPELKRIDYSDNEMMMIGDIIYNLKGSIESVILFCKYFYLKIYELSVDYSSVFLITTDYRGDDVERFRLLFTQLIDELLISNSVKIKINLWTIDAIINNDISINLSGTLLNYIKLVG